MNIAFLGDSITVGYALEDRSLRYSTLVSQRLGMEEENYGITGTLMARAGLNRENRDDFLSRIDLIDSADVAVIFGGTNDYFWSDGPLTGDSEDSFEGAVRGLLAYVREQREGRVTLFVTPYPHNGVGNYWGGSGFKEHNRHDTDTRNYGGYTLADYVRVMEEACRAYGVPCLCLHRDFDFDWRVHTVDGCHPNEEGHRRIADAVEKALLALIN